jgi:hypothetical protein
MNLLPYLRVTASLYLLGMKYCMTHATMHSMNVANEADGIRSLECPTIAVLVAVLVSKD